MVEKIVQSVSRKHQCVFEHEDVQLAEHIARVKSKGNERLFGLILETELVNVIMRSEWNG